MRLLRSWPRHIPEGRSHVIDGIDRFVVEHYDYRRLAMVRDDVLLIEWDLAVDPEQLDRFAGRCLQTPGRVRVAPYRLYYQYGDDVWDPDRRDPVWAHRRHIKPERLRWVTDNDQTCHLFGFGFVYLPYELLAEFCLDETGPLGDASFSHWHYGHADDREVVIDWDCRPVHLNHPPLHAPCNQGDRSS